MQVIDKSAEGLAREFNIVVPASSIEDRVVSRLNEVGRQVRVPGFRPGKVPMKLLKSRYGDSIRGEILDSTVQEFTNAAITEKALKPAMQPRVELVTFEEGKDLEFSVKLEVLPEIGGVDLSSLELNRPVAKATDEEVEKAVADLVKNQRTTEPMTEARGAQNGDAVIADFVGSIDGKEFPGGKATGATIELGSNTFIPGFEEQLVGAKVGDTVTVKVTFPESYGAKELAGEAAEFKVDVKEIRTFKTPELNDELAKQFGDENVESLKNRMRGFIQQNYDGTSRVRVKRQVLDKLAEGHKFEVPKGMVDIEFDAIWRRMEEVAKTGQYDEEDMGKSEDQLKAEYREIAERRVRLGLLLSEIGQKSGVQVTQDDLTKAVTDEAFRYPGQERQVIEFYQQNPQALESLRAPIFEEKVVDYIISQSKVTDNTVTVEQLMRDPDEAEAAEETGEEAAPKKKAKAKKSAAADSDAG